MDIVVLAAGSSSEREVSIRSSEMICKALRKSGHNAILVDVFFGPRDVNAFRLGSDYNIEDEVNWMIEMTSKVEEVKAARRSFLGENVIELCEESDIVFLGLHGQNGEDGRIQAAFDLMGIKYTGTGYFGSALAMDKGLTKEMFMLHNIPTPKGFVLTKDCKVKDLAAYGIEIPCVVKPCCGGSSIGISIVKSQDEYEAALEAAFQYEDEILVERYIQGREFSIGILGKEALPIIEIIPDGWYDYDNKYNGHTLEVCPAELSKDLTKDMQAAALKTAEVLRLEAYSRIDFLLDENNQFYCLEANTLPGMTNTSLLPQEAVQVGLDFPALCEKLIQISLEKYNK